MTRELTARIDEPLELSVTDVIAQVGKIQQIMRQAMREGIHYGIIPGTDKPSLLKAGAEKLGLTFRLIPSFQIARQNLDGGHREYEITCSLTHGPTGQVVGHGVGSCSTMESKYRWRRRDPENTNAPVPQVYWNLRKTDPQKAQELIGGKEFLPIKVDGAWMIFKRSIERFENPDIANTFNTVLKIAKKRALVDAMLTSTACSDIFTHEPEEESSDRGE